MQNSMNPPHQQRNISLQSHYYIHIGPGDHLANNISLVGQAPLLSYSRLLVAVTVKLISIKNYPYNLKAELTNLNYM
jgi:hypothetical protein